MPVTIFLMVADKQTPVDVKDRQDGTDVWNGIFDKTARLPAVIHSLVDKGVEFGTINVIAPDGTLIQLAGEDDWVVHDNDVVAISGNGKKAELNPKAAPTVGKAPASKS